MTLVTVTLNDVPEDCVAEVKRLATVAVDRYYKRYYETVQPEVIEAANKTKDNFRIANDLVKWYYPDHTLNPESEA
jgi:hypothetical protein